MDSALNYLQELEHAAIADPSNAALRKQLAELLIVTGHTLFDRLWDTENSQDLNLPIEWYRKALALDCPELEIEYIESLFRIAFCFHFQSMMEPCLKHIELAKERQAKLAGRHPLGKTNIRFLQQRSGIVHAIGHMANEPEILYKMGKLGLRDPLRACILSPKDEIVNPTLFNYWRPSIVAITDSSLCKRLKNDSQALEYNTFWVTLPPGNVHFQWPAMTIVNNLWQDLGHDAPLKISESHRVRGWDTLQKLGVPRGSWFVTLHVRDQRKGKLGKPIKAITTSNRDAKIESYFQAIKRITDAGGWVFRMGDVSMPELPLMERVVDYPHTAIRSDWMDIFLIAESRFLLATSSGLQGVANNFGVPVLLTNASPMNSWPLGKNDLYIPKLLRKRETGTLLPFSVALTEPFSYCFSRGVYEREGVDIIDNSEDEISEAVEEMMHRLSNRWNDTGDSLQRQEAFQKIVKEIEPYGIRCRAGSAFLKRYETLLR